jgi:SAM-dependent methyltransferase
VLFQEGDANALPFLDDSFDVVVCRSSLHHFPDPRRAVAEMARVCRSDGRVVVSDMIAPSTDVRERFDELHRHIDPSHVRALMEREVAELMQEVVGPLSYGDTTLITLPVDVIVTDAADRDAAMSMLLDDVGRNTTGFDPVRDGDDVMVSFTGTVVHASPST